MNRRRQGLDLRGIGAFLALAFGLTWLLALPMWLDDLGIQSPWARLIAPMKL